MEEATVAPYYEVEIKRLNVGWSGTVYRVSGDERTLVGLAGVGMTPAGRP